MMRAQADIRDAADERQYFSMPSRNPVRDALINLLTPMMIRFWGRGEGGPV
jgi:hypothetical protein